MIYNPVKNVVVKRLISMIEYHPVDIAEETNSRVGIFKSERRLMAVVGIEVSDACGITAVTGIDGHGRHVLKCGWFPLVSVGCRNGKLTKELGSQRC